MTLHSLFICQHYYPEEVSTGLHITELTTKMMDLHKEHQISVLCANPSKDEFDTTRYAKRETHKGVNIYRVKNFGKQHGSILSRTIFALSFFIKAIIYLVRHHRKYDNLIITTNPPFLSVIPLLIKSFINRPYVLIAYDIYPDIAIKLNIISPRSLISKFWRWINVKVYNSADAIVVIGEDMKKVVCESMNIKDVTKVHLIHNWSDKNVIYPVDKSNNRFINKYSFHNKRILLYSGTFGRTHNIEQILEAAEELKNYQDIVFIFVGNGIKKRNIEDKIIRSNLPNLFLLPYQPLSILADTQSASTISFVCLEDEFTGLSVPSKTYGIMAAGVPIIGLLRSDSEIAQTIKKYNCGRVLDHNKKLSALILEMLSNQVELELMGQNARNAFLQNFELEISVTKYSGIIQKLSF